MNFCGGVPSYPVQGGWKYTVKYYRNIIYFGEEPSYGTLLDLDKVMGSVRVFWRDGQAI